MLKCFNLTFQWLVILYWSKQKLIVNYYILLKNSSNFKHLTMNYNKRPRLPFFFIACGCWRIPHNVVHTFQWMQSHFHRSIKSRGCQFHIHMNTSIFCIGDGNFNADSLLGIWKKKDTISFYSQHNHFSWVKTKRKLLLKTICFIFFLSWNITEFIIIKS